MRYFELAGERRRAIMVLKMRGTAHDHSLYEFEITDGGIGLLEPLRGVSGMLGGSAHSDDGPAARGL
jgi:circadian clock protein KaiC